MAASLSRLFYSLFGKDMPGQKLFKLNRPPGWLASNDSLSGRLLASEDPPFGLSWDDLNEEMIFVTSSRCSLAIDLGWYPESSPEGQFRIEVVDFDNLVATYAKPLREFSTRSVWAAKQKMEEWMDELHALPGHGGPSEAMMTTTRDQLLRDIEAAFHDVARGNSLTLHEVAECEGPCCCTAEERARARALDPETRWQDIPDSALEECLDRWAFDEEGFRFHLPAYLRWYLRHPPGPEPPHGGLLYYQLTNPLFLARNPQVLGIAINYKPRDRVSWERSWDLYSREQKCVIARTLEFTMREEGPHAQGAFQTWRCYWHKFCEPGAARS